jgi:hypothetical protein
MLYKMVLLEIVLIIPPLKGKTPSPHLVKGGKVGFKAKVDFQRHA